MVSVFAFGVLRVIFSFVAAERTWRIVKVERWFIVAAVLYCLPQLFDLITHAYNVRAAAAELEGKAADCDRAFLRADSRSSAGLRMNPAA